MVALQILALSVRVRILLSQLCKKALPEYSGGAFLLRILSCICAVEDIETELSGLEYCKYTLVYTYKSSDGTITQEVTFDFSALLDMNVAFERTYVIPKS